jgi:hypothetical protein
MLIEEASDMAIITALAGAAEGRFKMLVRRAGSSEVYWAGWVHADDSSYPDNYYPFHFEIYATDGIARLKDIDYADDLGDPYQGEETLLQHLLKIIGKIGTDDVGTWPAAKVRSTANWFSNGMNTTTCPLHQAKLRHDRFHGLDRESNTQHWTCYAVLDAILRPLGCQLLHEDGMYHVRQLGKYHDNTQKAYYYDDAGTLLSSPTENLDITVDYATIGEMVKEAGGRYTFLPPLHEVCVDYHHQTSNDKGQGQVWNTGDETYHTLPGAVIVDAAGETFLRASLKIRHKSNVVVIPPGSQPYPDHRLRFSVQIRMEDGTNPGSHYYLRRIAGANTPFFDIQPTEMEWFFNGADNFKIWARPINDFDNNIEYELTLGFTTPSLPVEVSGSKIEMKIDLLGAEMTNGVDLDIDGVEFQGGITWYTKNVSVRVEGEGGGEAGSNDIERTCSSITDNIEKRLIETYIGDGPAPFSLSALHVGTAATATWKVNNSGTGIPLAKLLGQQTMRFRKKPQELFQVTFIHKDARPILRFVDDDKGYMATRISLSAFENKWSGEFIVMDGDVDGISSAEPYVPAPGTGGGPIKDGPPIGPPTTPDVPIGEEDGFTLPPFDGLQGGTLPGYGNFAEQSPVRLTAAILATDFNNTALSDDHQLPITSMPFKFAKKGDVVVVVNPITQHRESFTLSDDYGIGDTYLSVKTTETMTKNFPYGSFVKLSKSSELQVRGWSYYNPNCTGTGTAKKFVAISPDIGELPSPTDFTAETLRERVLVICGGTALIYDANNYDHAFGIKPSTNEIEVYKGCYEEAFFVLVR